MSQVYEYCGSWHGTRIVVLKRWFYERLKGLSEAGMKHDEKHLADLKYTSREIKKKSKKIYRQILAESENFDCGNFKAIETDDLARLFGLYDLYFFNRFFHNNYKEKISFRLSRRMTRAAGRIAYNRLP
jgi:hypothetical protein